MYYANIRSAAFIAETVLEDSDGRRSPNSKMDVKYRPTSMHMIPIITM